MKHEVICRWLGLPEGCWPPDHYTLLGLPPNEGDRARVEQQVHDRLAKVRCYQISHPEQATEAMNRLAQAFMCLSDPTAKTSYDAAHGLGNGIAKEPPHDAGNGAAAKVNDDTVTNFRTRIDWRSTAPPVRSELATAPDAVPAPPSAAPDSTAALVEAAPPVAIPALLEDPTPQPDDTEQAIACLEARRGLGTLPRLIERIEETRQLLWTWDQIGRFLKRKPRRLRAEEEKELAKRLAAVAELLEAYPKFLGQPGKPGYRVAAVASLDPTAHVFLSLDKHQRSAMAKDWLAGRQLLLCYRRYLHREFHSLRKASWLSRAIRVLRTAVYDHPILTAIAGLVIIAGSLWYWLR